MKLIFTESPDSRLHRVAFFFNFTDSIYYILPLVYQHLFYLSEICGFEVSWLRFVHQSCQGRERSPRPRKKPPEKALSLHQFPDRSKDKLPQALCPPAVFLPPLQGHEMCDTQLDGILLSHKREGRKTEQSELKAHQCGRGKLHKDKTLARPLGSLPTQGKTGTGSRHSGWVNPELQVASEGFAHPKVGEVQSRKCFPSSFQTPPPTPI